MTDKFEKDINVPSKIMIDSVDVSGCEFVVDCLPSADCTQLNCFCYECPNCYYKQLKRTQNQYNATIKQNKNLQQELRAEKQNSKHLEDLLNQAIKELEEERRRYGLVKTVIEILEMVHKLIAKCEVALKTDD